MRQPRTSVLGCGREDCPPAWARKDWLAPTLRLHGRAVRSLGSPGLQSWAIIALALIISVPLAAQAKPTTPIASQPYTWRNVEIGGGGGFITGIVFHPKQPGLAYCRTDIGGVYRWEAKAKRWVALTDWVGQEDGNLRGAESIAVDPTDPNRVYVAAGTYSQPGQKTAILRSTDQGRTWKKTPMPLLMGGNEDGRGIGERLAVDSSHPSTLYFGSRHDGLWRSGDYGATWGRVTGFPAVPNDPPSTPGAPWHPPRSAGIGWVVFDTKGAVAGRPTPTLYAGVAAPGIPALYRSVDAGATWQAVAGQPGGLIPQHAALAADGSLYVTYTDGLGPNGVSHGGVWKWDTHAGGWTDITPDRHSGYAGLALDARHPSTVMVATLDRWNPGDEIFRSTDGGAHWQGLSAGATRDVSGAPWLTWGAATAKFGWWLAALAIDPFHPGHVLYGTGATIWATDDVSPADNGHPTRWYVGALGIEETAVTALVSPSAGPPLISGLGDIGGFTHRDLRISPSEGMSHTPRFGATSGLDYASAAPSVVVRVGSGGDDVTDGRSKHGAYSLDGGLTWTPFATEPTGSQGSGAITVTADGGTFLWAAQGAPLAYSRDHGTHWTVSRGLPQPNPNEPRSYFGQIRLSITADRVNPQKIYALNGSGRALFVSADGGATFSQAAATGLPASGRTLDAAPGNEGDLWVTAGDAGLWHSPDSGATFNAVPTIAQADGLGFGKAAPGRRNPALYLVGTPATPDSVHGIYRSDDAGAHWVRINDDQHQYGWIGRPLTGDPRVYGRVYLGTNGRGILVGDPTR